LKTVQDMLGHTSYVVTADNFTTVLPDQAKRAAESTAQLGRRVGGGLTLSVRML
jgi:hypothetical protein